MYDNLDEVLAGEGWQSGAPSPQAAAVGGRWRNRAWRFMITLGFRSSQVGSAMRGSLPSAARFNMQPALAFLSQQPPTPSSSSPPFLRIHSRTHARFHFLQRLRPGDPLSIEGMAADALELFGLLGLFRPHIAGVSMGGMIAVAMAAEHGELLGSVIVAPGSAGSPRSRLPNPAFVQQVLSGRATKLDWLNAAFPLDTNAGEGWVGRKGGAGWKKGKEGGRRAGLAMGRALE